VEAEGGGERKGRKRGGRSVGIQHPMIKGPERKIFNCFLHQTKKGKERQEVLFEWMKGKEGTC